LEKISFFDTLSRQKTVLNDIFYKNQQVRAKRPFTHAAKDRSIDILSNPMQKMLFFKANWSISEGSNTISGETKCLKRTPS
jgi:hypothetical protein